jgi:hypothetical protein
MNSCRSGTRGLPVKLIMHLPDAAGVGLQAGEDSRYMRDNASTAALFPMAIA